MPEIPAVPRRLVLGGALATGALAAGMGSAQAAPAKAGTAATALEAAAAPRRARGQKSMINVPYEGVQTVRVGVIGLGNRGHDMTVGWSVIPGCTVTAVCDIRPERTKRTADKLVAEGKPRPLEFGGTADSYKELLKREDIDLVYIATPWEFHYEQGKGALLAGKHAAVELPIATGLDELWDLVDTSERTRKHLILAENCCYGRNELAMLKMAHDGAFGELTNGHGGYLHDLRELLFSDTYYTDSWRRLWHTRSRASFYPMHGLAPIAAAMDINRGDRFATLSATATEPKGLADYRERFVPKGHPSWKETYVEGDLTTCLIKTENGRLIRAEHDVSSPRPYSRINTLAGSRGIFEDYTGTDETGARIYFEPDHSGHEWRGFAAYQKEYDHWLWVKNGEDAENGGHGGMDYIMQWRIVQAMRAGLVPDFDVYDSAAWCSAVPLSVKSLEAGGRSVAVPDFTRGSWVGKRPGLDSKPLDMPPVR
ncbi:Gfo/Idh/MocA family oxidoreductase [Streptomyces sp. NA04227]|uniref:Gfo/Idh/MocA family protein n=1 Tax=Streptomyces sp. NA04227 TaxID=2742136 RepID=UPI0015912D2F|nr:Gfo/Idh/MocA family oxidoreductase [Streptomyces sp. NA04227]QKW06672.1 Gfo/Idh/MocA family oxidoreductase [Streptomyces sp. NA04227]